MKKLLQRLSPSLRENQTPNLNCFLLGAELRFSLLISLCPPRLLVSVHSENKALVLAHKFEKNNNQLVENQSLKRNLFPSPSFKLEIYNNSSF
jgi:hypothetical protein